MTPLATRLRQLVDEARAMPAKRKEDRQRRDGRGLLLSYRECEAVLRLLDAAKEHRMSFGCRNDARLDLTIAALEAP